MNKELKIQIINFIIENEKEFQLTNATVNRFRSYIYLPDGNYLIGGMEVADFINRAIDLIKN
jgi:hypothetical protein